MADAFDLFRLWWAAVPGRLGSATVDKYRYEVFAAYAKMGKHPATVLTREIEAHLGDLRPQHASLRRAALSDFHKWLVIHGYRPDNPLEDLRKIRIGKQKVRRAWSEEELWRTVFAALWMGTGPKDRGSGYQLAYMILAQYGLCLRPGEVVALSKDRIVLNGVGSCAHITNTKTGIDRTVPVVGVAREALERLVELTPETSSRLIHFGRPHYWQKVHTAALLAGVPPEKCRPYSLRHTGATHLAERGVQPRVIAEILGHSDLRHVMTYAAPTSEEMRQALSKLG